MEFQGDMGSRPRMEVMEFSIPMMDINKLPCHRVMVTITRGDISNHLEATIPREDISNHLEATITREDISNHLEATITREDISQHRDGVRLHQGDNHLVEAHLVRGGYHLWEVHLEGVHHLGVHHLLEVTNQEEEGMIFQDHHNHLHLLMEVQVMEGKREFLVPVGLLSMERVNGLLSIIGSKLYSIK